MHQNRKADWAVTAQCYSNRGPSALKARTVRRWNSRRVPEKVWFCVIVKKCTADRPVLYREPSAVQRQIGFQKHTVSECDLEMNCGPSAGEWRTGPSAVQRTGKQLSARFLVVSMCKWRTVRKNSETHRRGHRRQVRPRIWSGFVPKGF